MFKIFVGNLNLITTGESIRKLFTRHADVSDIALPLNPETGKSRGFAIVMIKDEQQARTAMAALRGARLDGRALVINEARKKGEAPPPKREGVVAAAEAAGADSVVEADTAAEVVVAAGAADGREEAAVGDLVQTAEVAAGAIPAAAPTADHAPTETGLAVGRATPEAAVGAAAEAGEQTSPIAERRAQAPADLPIPESSCRSSLPAFSS